MPKIALVLFDMHDVLCRYDLQKRLAGLARLSGRTPREIHAAIWESGFESEADAGRLDAQAYLEGFGQRLGYPITLDEWLKNRKRAITPIPEVLGIMAALRGKPEIAVLTNNHTLVRTHLPFLFPELEVLCGEKFYVSAQFGAVKPDAQAYLRCVAAAGAAPDETLFIDDSRKNVEGALAAGLQGHVFTGAGALRAALAGHGVL